MFRYDRLDQLIKETGKKKTYLCAKLKKCQTYLRDAKKQNTNIKGEDLKILAEELNTTPEYLTGETDKKEKPSTQEGEGLGISEEDLAHLAAFHAADENTKAAIRLLLQKFQQEQKC